LYHIADPLHIDGWYRCKESKIDFLHENQPWMRLMAWEQPSSAGMVALYVFVPLRTDTRQDYNVNVRCAAYPRLPEPTFVRKEVVWGDFQTGGGRLL